MTHVASFEGLIALDRRGRALRRSTSCVLAVLAHAGLGWGAMQAEAPIARPVASITEVELLPPPREVEAPAPEPEPEEARTPEAPAPTPPPRAPRARPAPAQGRAAAAGKLLTADEAAPTASEPVRFVTDPNGGAYGMGVVAVGGSARRGDGPAVTPAPVQPRAETKPAPAVKLSRAPQLVGGDPCRGFFPQGTQVDRGEADVRVSVSAEGRVTKISVAREEPAGQGFGGAARRCLGTAQFAPALDERGLPVPWTMPVTVKFSR